MNAPFTDGAFAIFTGAAGEVTVDNGLGAVTASGMQFATDGYSVAGDPITLAGAPDAIVRVGDGTADSAAMTATIAAELTGASQLTKTDLGTLVLSGANSYTGGTAIDGGVLRDRLRRQSRRGNRRAQLRRRHAARHLRRDGRRARRPWRRAAAPSKPAPASR